MTAWDTVDLVAAAEASGLAATVALEASTSERRLSGDQLERWLARDSGPDGRPSYLAALAAAGLDEAALARVSAFYRAQLRGRVVRWTTTTAYLLATQPA
jgi:formylmethanofuran:tetrahydromethanopterin formyltransferase